MRPHVQLMRAAVAVVFAGLGAAPFANAQFPAASDLTATTAGTTTDGGSAPTTATQTGTTATNTGNAQTRTTNTQTNTGTTGTNTGTTTGTGTTGRTTQTTTGSTGRTTNSASATGSGSSIATSGTFPANPTSSSSATRTTTGAGGITLSNAPTLQGVGIPTMIVPYTASAPFMRKSSLPEGTVFIAVGAVLAFMAVCVIAWRAIVAWSINRSVKRAAMASILAAETKSPGGWASNPFKPAGGFYTQAPGGSALSLGEHHGPARGEKNARSSTYRSNLPSTGSGLFFSPTANNQSGTNIPMTGLSSPGGHGNANRSSTYLPAGYYASPSAQIGGGMGTTTIGGGNMPPYAQPTGNSSPVLHPHRSSLHRPASHIQLGPPSRGGLTERVSSSGLRPHSGLHPQGSASSLRVGTGHNEDGVRAPSAYLEDLFEGHGNPAVAPPQPYHR